MKPSLPNTNKSTFKIPFSQNRKYPNREPNQPLKDRSRQFIQTKKKAVVKPPTQEGIIQQRRNVQDDYDT